MTISNAQVVREFYAALATRDAEAFGTLIAGRFAEDVEMIIPAALPYGGKIVGSARLGRMLAGLVASPVPVGTQNLVLDDVVDDGDRIVARLSFDWYAPGSADHLATGALELWTFTAAGAVREIRAYYEDTAACARLVEAVRA